MAPAMRDEGCTVEERQLHQNLCLLGIAGQGGKSERAGLDLGRYSFRKPSSKLLEHVLYQLYAAVVGEGVAHKELRHVFPVSDASQAKEFNARISDWLRALKDGGHVEVNGISAASQLRSASGFRLIATLLDISCHALNKQLTSMDSAPDASYAYALPPARDSNKQVSLSAELAPAARAVAERNVRNQAARYAQLAAAAADAQRREDEAAERMQAAFYDTRSALARSASGLDTTSRKLLGSCVPLDELLSGANAAVAAASTADATCARAGIIAADTADASKRGAPAQDQGPPALLQMPVSCDGHGLLPLATGTPPLLPRVCEDAASGGSVAAPANASTLSSALCVRADVAAAETSLSSLQRQLSTYGRLSEMLGVVAGGRVHPHAIDGAELADAQRAAQSAALADAQRAAQSAALADVQRAAQSAALADVQRAAQSAAASALPVLRGPADSGATDRGGAFHSGDDGLQSALGAPGSGARTELGMVGGAAAAPAVIDVGAVLHDWAGALEACVGFVHDLAGPACSLTAPAVRTGAADVAVPGSASHSHAAQLSAQLALHRATSAQLAALSRELEARLVVAESCARQVSRKLPSSVWGERSHAATSAATATTTDAESAPAAATTHDAAAPATAAASTHAGEPRLSSGPVGIAAAPATPAPLSHGLLAGMGEASLRDSRASTRDSGSVRECSTVAAAAWVPESSSGRHETARPVATRADVPGVLSEPPVVTRATVGSMCTQPSVDASTINGMQAQPFASTALLATAADGADARLRHVTAVPAVHGTPAGLVASTGSSGPGAYSDSILPQGTGTMPAPAPPAAPTAPAAAQQPFATANPFLARQDGAQPQPFTAVNAFLARQDGAQPQPFTAVNAFLADGFGATQQQQQQPASEQLPPTGSEGSLAMLTPTQLMPNPGTPMSIGDIGGGRIDSRAALAAPPHLTAVDGDSGGLGGATSMARADVRAGTSGDAPASLALAPPTSGGDADTPVLFTGRPVPLAAGTVAPTPMAAGTVAPTPMAAGTVAPTPMAARLLLATPSPLPGATPLPLLHEQLPPVPGSQRVPVPVSGAMSTPLDAAPTLPRDIPPANQPVTDAAEQLPSYQLPSAALLPSNLQPGSTPDGGENGGVPSGGETAAQASHSLLFAGGVPDGGVDVGGILDMDMDMATPAAGDISAVMAALGMSPRTQAGLGAGAATRKPTDTGMGKGGGAMLPASGADQAASGADQASHEGTSEGREARMRRLTFGAALQPEL